MSCYALQDAATLLDLRLDDIVNWNLYSKMCQPLEAETIGRGYKGSRHTAFPSLLMTTNAETAAPDVAQSHQSTQSNHSFRGRGGN